VLKKLSNNFYLNFKRIIDSCFQYVKIRCFTHNFSVNVFSQTKPKLIVETDLGGDADDQGSLVRLLLYSNDFDLKGIILSRDNSKFLADGASSNPSGASTTYEMASDYIDAYGAVYNKLILHDDGYQTAQTIKNFTKEGWGTDGKNLIIDALKNNTGIIWYTNWGCNEGNVSSLKKALDDIKNGLVSGLNYTDVMSRLYYVEEAKQNHICTYNYYLWTKSTFWSKS